MQTTSATYKQILAGDHIVEPFVYIKDTDGTDRSVRNSALVSVEITEGCFDKTFGIGNAVSSEIHLQMLNPAWIPARMARMMVYYRIKNATQTSEWLRKGIFYIDTRERTKSLYGDDILDIHGYDGMLMSEQMYAEVTWTTKKDWEVLQEICSKLGWSLNSETLTYIQTLTTVNIKTPFGFTYREVLQSIAGIRAGNFVMDEYGRLKLIPLTSAPAETFYLITPQGDPIKFGGDRIVLQ